MAASPRWKVYDLAGHYQAACKELEAAAQLVGFYSNHKGMGATIRNGQHGPRHIVWTEGKENMPAAESYDNLSKVVFRRIKK